MQITNPIDFMVVGGLMRYLAGLDAGSPIFGHNFVYNNLAKFREDLERLGFVVSRNLYDGTLLDIENEFTQRLDAVNRGEDEGLLSEDDRARLIQSILEFEKTVFAEARTRVIAAPVPRRFALEHLLHQPGAILGQGVFDHLSDLAQYDLAQSCRCIAFECPTAAAFHALRCVEECLRVLFKAYFPRGDTHRPWGALSGELRNKPRQPKPDDLILDHLDHLRTRFRNPTDHPEKIFEIEEVEDLVHMAVDIINRCTRDPQVERRRT